MLRMRYVGICACSHGHWYVHVDVSMHVCMYLCTHTFRIEHVQGMFVCTYVCIYACTRVLFYDFMGLGQPPHCHSSLPTPSHSPNPLCDLCLSFCERLTLSYTPSLCAVPRRPLPCPPIPPCPATRTHTPANTVRRKRGWRRREERIKAGRRRES